MANMFVSGLCFSWAVHDFLEKEWIWGVVQASLGVLNLIVAFV
jgi:hypothetical protein